MKASASFEARSQPVPRVSMVAEPRCRVLYEVLQRLRSGKIVAKKDAVPVAALIFYFFLQFSPE